jgi:hypothetical protein
MTRCISRAVAARFWSVTKNSALTTQSRPSAAGIPTTFLLLVVAAHLELLAAEHAIQCIFADAAPLLLTAQCAQLSPVAAS